MKQRTYSESIANAIMEFLTGDDWHFSFDEQRGRFRFGLSLKGRIKNVSFVIVVKESSFLVYAISPVGAEPDDKKMMCSMSEFICRANYGINNGTFEFDWRDGEVRYKIFCDCEGIGSPSREMVENSIYCSAAAFARYGAGIANIIFLNSPAAEAIVMCEKNCIEEYRADVRAGMDDEVLEDLIAQQLDSLGYRIDNGLLETVGNGSDDEEDDLGVVLELFKPKGDVEG